MNNKKISSIWIIAIFFAALSLNSCKSNAEETYTVWTDVATYSEFESAFNTTLDNGYYLRLEFTSSQWSQISPSLTNVGKHRWTKDQIKDWLIGRGFGDTESTRESAWMTTIDHGLIASRTNSTVYLILK